MAHGKEVFVSVDVETTGPIPGEYSMLSIGACLVDAPEQTFECILKPLNKNFVPEALAVTGFELNSLATNGTEPGAAMLNLQTWVRAVCGEDNTPVFVGLNAPFDWSFINYYFHLFTGENPFGFAALDIKAYFMGVTGSTWRDTRSSAIAKRVHPQTVGDHNAVHDAVYQAELFRLTRDLREKGRNRS